MAVSAPQAAAIPAPLHWTPRQLEWVALPVLAAALALALNAGLARQGLFGDGAAFLAYIVAHGTISVTEIGRVSANLLQMGPGALAVRLGIGDVHFHSVFYSLWVAALPALGLVACYFVVPARSRHAFVFPLAYYVLAWPMAGFLLVHELQAATAYFWILFLLLLFRLERPGSRVAYAILAAPALLLYQTYVFLGPVLALAAAWRMARAVDAGERRWFLAFVLWFAVVAAVQLALTIFPPHPGNASDLFDSIGKLYWLRYPGGIANGPAMLGLAVLGALLAAGVALFGWPEVRAMRTLAAILAAIAIAACVRAVAGLWAFDGSFHPAQQAHARAVPALLSAGLALLLLLALRWPRWRRFWDIPGLPAVLLALAAANFGWQAVATDRWVEYVRIWEKILASHRGLVPWETALASVSAREADILRRIAWGWTQPMMSMALARDGKVTTIVANRKDVAWELFDPRRPETRYPGPRFDFEGFRRALREAPVPPKTMP